jgi:hypothetical protein
MGAVSVQLPHPETLSTKSFCVQDSVTRSCFTSSHPGHQGTEQSFPQDTYGLQATKWPQHFKIRTDASLLYFTESWHSYFGETYAQLRNAHPYSINDQELRILVEGSSERVEAEDLWDYCSKTSVSTLEGHVGSLRKRNAALLCDHEYKTNLRRKYSRRLNSAELLKDLKVKVIIFHSYMPA